MNDPYEVLGISRDAYKKDIQARYEILKNIWNPEQQTDATLRKTAEAELKRIEEAYAVLMDPKARVAAHYNEDEGEITNAVKPVSEKPRSVQNKPKPILQVTPTPIIQERIIKPTLAQRSWWLFALIALFFIASYSYEYNVMLEVAADRDVRIEKLNSYIDWTNTLLLENDAQHAEIELLTSENSNLSASLSKKSTDYMNMSTKYSNLNDKVYCAETRDKSLPINKSLIALVNSYRDITNSYATDEQLFTNNVYSMSRFRVWYSGYFVEQFFYYTNETVTSDGLISNVFWANNGCWIK